MSEDTKKDVVINILADAKQFRAEMKKVASDSNSFDKSIKSLKKSGIKEDKSLQKISKDFAKFNKSEGKDALKHEKQLLAAMKERSKVLNSMFSAGKGDSKTFKANRKELQEMANAYADIKKQRVEMIGLTRREKMAEKGGGMISSIAGIGKWGLLAGLGAGVGAITSRVNSSADAAANHRAGLMGLAGDRQAGSDYKGWRAAGVDMGFGPDETIQDAARLSRVSGSASNIVPAQQFARAGMLDMGQSTSFFGANARANNNTADAAKNQTRQSRELQRIMTSAVSTGLERGRFGEFLEGVTGLVEGGASRSAGNVSSGDYASLLAAIGSSGRAGMTGARGAAVLSQLEQGVMKPGGGDAGQALVLRSKGFGGPGGSTSYYDALKRQQRGFSGEKGADELAAFVKQTQSEYGGNSEAARLATSNMTGLSLDIVEEVFKAVAEMGGSAKLTEKIAKLTEDSESVEQQALNVMKTDLAEQSKRQSSLQMMLVSQGEDVVGSTQKIQDILNDAMNRIWPAVAKSLEFIADVLSDTYNFWKESPILNALGGASDEEKAMGEQVRQFATFIKKGEEGLNPNYRKELLAGQKAFSKHSLSTNGDKTVDAHEEKILSMYADAMSRLPASTLGVDTAAAENRANSLKTREAKVASQFDKNGMTMNIAEESIDKLSEKTAEAQAKKQIAKSGRGAPIVVPVATTYTGR